jgi:hypothetical protein
LRGLRCLPAPSAEKSTKHISGALQVTHSILLYAQKRASHQCPCSCPCSCSCPCLRCLCPEAPSTFSGNVRVRNSRARFFCCIRVVSDVPTQQHRINSQNPISAL